MNRSSMDSHLFYRLQFLLYQLAFAVCLVSVCRGDIEVTVSSKGAVESTRVTLSCEYNIVSPASFFSLLWVKLTDGGTTNIAYYRTSVTYYGNYTSGYEMSTDNIATTGTNLTIFTVSERVDNGTYRCDLTVDDSGFKPYHGLGDLTVIQDPCTSSSAPCNNKGNCTIDGLGYSCECVEGYSGPTCETVKPSSIQLWDEDGKSWNNSDMVTLDPKEASYSFTCKVPGIYPGIASFKWTVGGDVLTGVHLPDTVDGAGLITSSSKVTLTSPLTAYDKKRLQCEAMDEDGNVDASIGVMLNIPSTGGAGSILSRLDVILACLALTAVYMFNHGI